MGVRRFNRRQYATPLPETLALDFIGRGDILDPRITFSRASNATLVNSAGAVAYAPHNLLTFSESFDNSAWVKASATVAANTAVAPNGTTTADTITFAAAGGDQRATQGGVVPSGASCTFSVWLKGTAGQTVNIELDTTAVTVTLTNAFVRYSVTGPSAATTAVCRVISRAGNTATVLNVWGAQLNVGALQPYYCTTVENALGFTQEFNNAAWTKTNSSITANATAAPDGSLTADKLVENTATSSHFCFQAITNTNVTLTNSVYAKAGERSYLRMQLSNFATGAAQAVFDLVNGTIHVAAVNGGDFTGASASIVFVGNGWYRCSLTATKGAVNTTIGAVYSLDNGATNIYTGDGTSGIFIWGAQLSDSASLDPYVYNPAAAFTSTAYYGPRFDYDPVTLAPRGLLIEEQRTNSIRNNTMVGAVAGTPGTTPTNWFTFTTLTGLTSQVVGTGAENGITYLDFRLSGTPSAAGVYLIGFDGGNAIPASNGQTWAASVYAKLAGGSLSNVSLAQVLTERNAAAGELARSSQAFTPTTAALSTQRTTVTRLNNNASTVYELSFLQFDLTGAAIDITLRIGLPQLELGAFATSVIPTTTAAATRTTDFASMVGDNFSNWYNQPEGMMFVEGSVAFPVSGGNQFLVRASDNSYNNNIGLLISSGGLTQISTAAGGVFDGLAGNFLTSANVVFKTAGTYKINDLGSSSNGNIVAIDATATIPLNLTRLDLGGDHAGFNRIRGGHIRRIAYYPRRLPDDQLRGITV